MSMMDYGVTLRGGTVHSELKMQAYKFLIEEGFNEKDIKYEYTVKIGKKKYIVDVVGLKNGVPHTAIECGGVQDKDKLIQLKALFENVIHMPYVDKTIVTKMNEYERMIKMQQGIIEQLQKQIKKGHTIESSSKSRKVAKSRRSLHWEGILPTWDELRPRLGESYEAWKERMLELARGVERF